MAQRRKGTGIYPIYTMLSELDNMIKLMPEKYGAHRDKRIKRDTWIWVKPEYQVEARDFLTLINVPCVSLEKSETWY